MSEARDRLVRQEPREAFGGIRFDSPVRFNNNTTNAAAAAAAGGGVGRYVLFGSPAQVSRRPVVAPGMTYRGRGRGTGSPMVVRRYSLIGQENFLRGGRGRGGPVRRNNASALPSWYPRTPLRDVTAVVRAVERRRARLGEVGSPLTPQNLGVPVPDQPTAGARLEHDNSLNTPTPVLAATKGCPMHVNRLQKSLLGNKKEEDSDFLTPQKRLLNSIDQVEKVVMEELKRMKSTPSAKGAERQKKVRTLMAMR